MKEIQKTPSMNMIHGPIGSQTATVTASVSNNMEQGEQAALLEAATPDAPPFLLQSLNNQLLAAAANRTPQPD